MIYGSVLPTGTTGWIGLLVIVVVLLVVWYFTKPWTGTGDG